MAGEGGEGREGRGQVERAGEGSANCLSDGPTGRRSPTRSPSKTCINEWSTAFPKMHLTPWLGIPILSEWVCLETANLHSAKNVLLSILSW